MNITAAKEFIKKNARPIDLAVYEYFYEGGPRQKVIKELKKFKNPDGGFGNGLEPDFLNPNSTPIATNDAILTLYKTDAIDTGSDIVRGIVRYLESHDSFDEDKKRWLFAVDGNMDYPHAVWWEKQGDGISGFNPTISLAAFTVCFGERTELYEDIIREGKRYLEENEGYIADDLKCYLLAHELLRSHKIYDIVDLDELKALIVKRISGVICKDLSKYGEEYVPLPSDFFAGKYLDLVTSAIRELIDAEKEILHKLQKEDGGFDISWQWYTPYKEFEEARKIWRPRLTIDKLLFYEAN